MLIFVFRLLMITTTYDFRSQIFIAPSGVQKERMKPDDMFVQTIDDVDLELPPPEKM